ncbi:MAG: TIGR01777 family oxidoreductase [Bryobacteraceae bacterium]
MKITVTGGTGFLGRRLVKRLLADQHALHLLVRKVKTGFGPEVDCSVWDGLEIEPAPEAVEGAEAVIHLAGEPVAQRWTLAAKQRIRRSRVEGTKLLVHALERQKQRPAVLVCASAIGYYGTRGDELLTEASEPGQGFLPEVCREWEAAADEAERLGIQVVKLRFGIVLGSEGGALAQMLLPFRWGMGGKIGNGRQWMSWIHVGDAVELIAFALSCPGLRGAVNACAPNPVRNEEFTQTLASVLRRPALFTIPERALRILYGEMAEVVLASLRVMPEAALRAGFVFRYPELGPALGDLLG